MNLFHRYIKSTKQTMASFGKKLGISQSHMSDLANFKKPMKAQMAYDIEVLTAGLIAMDFWVEKERPHLEGGVVKSHGCDDPATRD